MNRERLFKHLEDHYIPKREMISRIPLGVQPDEFWRDVLNRRRSRSISLNLHNPRGIPYWYVVTNKMITASEQIVAEMLENETEFDPYKDTPSSSSLEESFFTSYVEGSQLSLHDAMEFIQGDREPEAPEEQMIINNRNALSFVGSNLFRPVDEDYIRTLAYILTENIEGGGQEFRLDDCPQIPSMTDIPYELPIVSTLQDRMNEICMFLHDPAVHPLIKAGIAQAWVLVTRPFPEGNERLGRMLSQVILFRAGYVFFSEISLSALIARSSYAYFNAISNILLPENGADLTYFLEYFLHLLAKGVEERHQRIKQRMIQDQATEQELAKTPLTKPSEPEQLRIDETEAPETKERKEVFSEASPFVPDIPGEINEAERGDKYIIQEKFEILKRSPSRRQRECADVLKRYLNQGKTTLTVADLMNDLHIREDSAGRLISSLKNKNIITSVGKEGKRAIYGFSTIDQKPSFAEDHDYSVYTQDTIVKKYSPKILETIKSLTQSNLSPKDRRIGAVLTGCLSDGIVRKEYYDTFGKPDRWNDDLRLAYRMGIVEKVDDQTYRILQDVKAGPGELLPSQKEIATSLYNSFGDEFFSSEMVVATLDYSSAHVCATLHQFTLLKILQCNREKNNEYQFIVNPRENPECFSAVA